MTHPSHRRGLRALLAVATLTGGLALGEAVAQPLERARAAQARGDLRAAQIEFRNAVRAEPQAAAVRLGLATVSLDLGDAETAEREVRAAIERGAEPLAATRLLIRIYMTQNRPRDLLRDLPLQEAPGREAVAGLVAAGRAAAELALREVEAARASVAAAQRLAPGAPDTQLMVASLASLDGDRAGAEAAVDRALAADPDFTDALLRKATLQAERGDSAAAQETLARLLARAPGHVPARLLRADLLMRAGDDTRARADVEAALRVLPGSVPANYLRALLLVRAQDWRGADEVLQRLGPVLPNLPDGLLMLATVKQAINQGAQALDAAQRHFARRPEDPRGAKLLAAMQMEAGRPGEAAATLARHVGRAGADAEAFDMLGRAHTAAGRPREAVQAFEQAAQLAPADGAIRTRLAAARLAMGDMVGAARTAEEALQAAPGQSGARELLAIAALTRGNITAAQAEWDRLDAAQRRSDPAGSLEGLLRLARFDIPGARTAFETTLRNHPESVGARLGLARVASAQGNQAEAERLLGEVLRRAPAHPEALSRLVTTVATGGPRGASARVVLEEVQAAQPAEPALALALATALASVGEPARALAVLNGDALRRAGQGVGLPLTRSQILAGLERWDEAEQAARAALSEDSSSVPARRQLMALLLRAGDARAAEALVQDGLRTDPGNAALQALLVGLTQQVQGLDAALAVADRLAVAEASRPASLFLRGDLLLAAQRPAEAARAFAAAREHAPSSDLVLREAMAWQAAGQAAPAVAALNAWLARSPEDPGVLNMLAQFDIQAGRTADAVRRLGVVVERAPDNAVALNNLAWLLADRGGEGPELARARGMAERAYFLLPSAETADTFGWILARSGEMQQALVLLRQAAGTPRPQGQAMDPGKVFRLAFVLQQTGQRDEALRVLEPALAGDAAFPERARAERLLAELRARR